MKMCSSILSDEYSFDDSSLYYISESIPSALNANDKDSESIHVEFNTQLEGCACIQTCCSKCSCIHHYIHYSTNQKLAKIPAQYFAKDGTETTLSDHILEFDYPIYECNSACNCKSTCVNRLVQLGPRKGLKIVNTPCILLNGETFSKGRGLSTINKIPKGGFICEYAGEIISKMEAFNRHKIYDENKKMNYIICLNEYTGANKIQTFIDPSEFGNIGRYLNHSCDPNCVMIPIRVNTSIPKLCIFSLKDIEIDVELTFDYGIAQNNHQICNSKKIKMCLCNTQSCKKWLPNFDYDSN